MTRRSKPSLAKAEAMPAARPPAAPVTKARRITPWTFYAPLVGALVEGPAEVERRASHGLTGNAHAMFPHLQRERRVDVIVLAVRGDVRRDVVAVEDHAEVPH